MHPAQCLRKALPHGSRKSRILILGDSPDEREEARGEAFSATTGMLLDSMLHEVGILRTEALCSYICPIRPLGGKLDGWYSTKKKCPDATWACVSGVWLHPVIQQGIIEAR